MATIILFSFSMFVNCCGVMRYLSFCLWLSIMSPRSFCIVANERFSFAHFSAECQSIEFHRPPFAYSFICQGTLVCIHLLPLWKLLLSLTFVNVSTSVPHCLKIYVSLFPHSSLPLSFWGYSLLYLFLSPLLFLTMSVPFKPFIWMNNSACPGLLLFHPKPWRGTSKNNMSLLSCRQGLPQVLTAVFASPE